jgi:hypothetical protein
VEPGLKPGAEAFVYVVSRPARNRAVVSRHGQVDSGVTLLEWSRLRPVSWTVVARAILVDALAEPPVRKLTQDYGRFMFTPVGETRSVTGAEIDEWISTWSLPRFPGEVFRPERR